MNTLICENICTKEKQVYNRFCKHCYIPIVCLK